MSETIGACKGILVMGLRFIGVVSLLLLVAVRVHAEDLDMGGQRISVPTPNGFSPLGSGAPQFRTMAQRNLLPDSRLIEFYLTEGDLQEVRAGRSKSRHSTMQVIVPTSQFGRDLSNKEFLELASEIRLSVGKNDEAIRSQQNLANIRNHTTQNGSIVHVDSSKRLGVFLDEKDAIGTATVQTLHAGEVDVERVSANISMRVKNRLLMLSCSTRVDAQQDIGGLLEACSHWSQRVLAEN
jgi:hypothetical protein